MDWLDPAVGKTKIVRAVLVALWIVFLALYVAAKIHFFTRYGRVGTGVYIREHSVYWVGLAAVLFLVWVISKLFPSQRQ